MNWNRIFTASGRTRPLNAPEPPPQGVPARPNGRMHVRPPADPNAGKSSRINNELFSALLGIVLALSMGAMLMMMNASADFCFTMTAIIGLGGIIVHEVITRRGWEKLVSVRLEDTAMMQEKLAREVVRNTSDINNLKDGLAETAAALDVQAKRLPAAAASIESRMLNMIAQRLGSIGKGRGPKLQPQNVDNPDDIVLDLELAPPPRKAAPVSKLEEALNPRGKKFSDSVLTEMVRNAVRNEKIEMYAQPVVTLPQRKAKMIELFARVKARSGITLPAERYMKVGANDTMPTIDNWLLVHALKALSDPAAMIPGDLACMLNIEAAMLRNARFMKELVGFLGKNKDMASRLVFELAQADLDTLDPALEPVIKALTRVGCRFSMDSVRRRRVNVTRLKALNIRFLKLDGAWLIREAQQPGGAARVNRLKTQLDAAGIDLIVERIESEDELRELLDFPIDFGQGYLFARPEHYGAWRDRHFSPKHIGKAA